MVFNHMGDAQIFERDGSNLACEVPVSFSTAALGGTVEVPTLEGNVSLKVPYETQSGRVFRLREKGVKPVRGGGRGDLYCRVMVETPVNLNSEQRELLRKFEDSLRADDDGKHSPREEGFFEGEDARHVIDPRPQLFHSPDGPGPKLRGDILQRGNFAIVSGTSEMEIHRG